MSTYVQMKKLFQKKKRFLKKKRVIRENSLRKAKRLLKKTLKTGKTLREMAKAAKIIYQRRKKIAIEALPLSVEKSASPSLENEEVETEEIAEEEVPSRKRGKGKDIAIAASILKTQSVEKMAFKPISRAKYFDFESLETKGWNLKEFTDPQGWSGFVSTQCKTFASLVKELYANMTVKEHNEEKFLESIVKGVRIHVSQNFLSNVLNIANKGNQLDNSWLSSLGVTRENTLQSILNLTLIQIPQTSKTHPKYSTT